MRVKPGVHTYDLEWEGFREPLSVHVVEADETLLFGAGDVSTADELAEIARDHEADAVVVEHGDADHYAGVPRLRESEPGIEVAVPAKDASFLREDGVEPDVLLEPDDVYRGVKVVGAPGHTPGNAAYLYDDVLVAGDTVVGSDSVFARASAPDSKQSSESALSVIEADWNADDEEAVDSVGNLLEHGFDTVLVTHGSNVVGDAKREVERLIDGLE
ncbi:MAG: MBL fold metallo-hydrolase [Halobacteriales archaeon]|nr:MBL fold metallo-hydrolase [Halobacteriales archaeon]